MCYQKLSLYLKIFHVKNQELNCKEQKDNTSNVIPLISSLPPAISQTAKSGTAPTKKGWTPNPLSAVAKMEHAVVGQALMDVIGPRLTQEVGTTGSLGCGLGYCNL